MNSIESIKVQMPSGKWLPLARMDPDELIALGEYKGAIPLYYAWYHDCDSKYKFQVWPTPKENVKVHILYTPKQQVFETEIIVQ